ncbi:IclR family transcriptional regulator [Rhodococcus jostii]|uniref:DNA-binding transcriptional regulator, IclR family n=1 Tax=Rhodococcus jostii TaxID=132919 RepID=A0A1H5D3A7_RHOJO|nr:IclR family transcriptional regulator [Rhodococcus jostii]SED73284.1 DNA-binding transcriptional regulator, IclR family [Rhodococcus jostii]
MADEQRKTVGVLSRAFAIIDAVETRPMITSELARTVGLSKSTTQRLVTELANYGYLRRDSGGRYWLGYRFTAAGMSDIALPVLRDLSESTGESSQLWVRRGDLRLCVASIESSNELRATMPVGTAFPLAEGSSGHVLAGDFDDDPAARRRGWWQTLSERVPGLGSVSAPVRVDGEIVASVCVSGPLHRLGDDPGDRLGPAAIDAAQRIEKSLRDS